MGRGTPKEARGVTCFLRREFVCWTLLDSFENFRFELGQVQVDMSVIVDF